VHVQFAQIVVQRNLND